MYDKNYRLSKNVMPSRYVLRIDANLDEWHYVGEEVISVRVVEPTREVALHANDLEIVSATALVGGKELSATVATHKEAEVITLNFSQEIPQGEAELKISFKGIILERLRGFYRSEKDGDRYAVTQFEPADARRAFPCFDEPEFKARFALTLVIPKNLTAVSNGSIQEIKMQGDHQEITFTETPPIATYLVAFCIGPFEATEIATTKTNIPVRVVLPTGLANKGIYAREAHVRAVQYLEEYTAIPYPYKKIDAIGIPDFEAGAMENPAAITYRLTEIAADPEHASTNTLKSIFYTTSHELTHMWWGDLVTMRWWNDLWLNESFATFIGFKVTSELNPEWEMWRDFVADLARPFSLDALVSTHPISFDVQNAKQASERFDVITYWKGAGVVSMIENFLGADVFRAGVRSYLKKYRESNATADDFWHELTTASDRDVVAIANAWIKEPGHPVVRATATREGNNLRLQLRQERFFTDPAASVTQPPQAWPIPLVIKFGQGKNTREKPVLMTDVTSEVILENAEWFFLNAGGAGFYRYIADEASNRTLAAVVPEVLKPHERLALLDNQWALLRAGILSLKQFLTLLHGFRKEKDRAVLAVVTDHLHWLHTHIVDDHMRERFEQFIKHYYEPHHEELGWEPVGEEPVDIRLKRATIIGALGHMARHQHIRREARTRLEKHFAEPHGLDPNLASVVAHVSAREGDEALYDQYLDRKRASSADPEEEIRFLMALTSFEHPDLVERTLNLALSGDVRSQDRAFLFAGLLGRHYSRDAAWKFVRERWDEIAHSLDPMMLQNLIRSLSALMHEPMASDVRAFLRQKTTDETRETISQVEERLRLDAAVVERLVQELEEALGMVEDAANISTE